MATLRPAGRQRLLRQVAARFSYLTLLFTMKTIFPAPTRRRNFLVFSRFSGLIELGQAIGLSMRQFVASPGCLVGQGTLPGHQRFLRVQ